MRASWRRWMVVEALGALALLFALCCGSASAKIVLEGSFEAAPGIEALAVDSSSGDVYAYDRDQQAIFKYDADGEPADFSATGSNEISGVGFPNSYDEAELAVDTSAGPAKGDLYLARGGQSVQVFSAAGAKLGEFADAGSGTACGVAVDPSGAVYVALSGGQVNKYVPSANPVTDADLSSTLVGLGETCNLAVDSAGNLFVDYKHEPVMRYEASQFGSLAPSGSVVDMIGGALAVDLGTDKLYVDERQVVSQFGSHGEPFEEPLATFGNEVVEASDGIAINAMTHYIYVSAGYYRPGIEIYANVTKPQVVTFAASHVNATSATLNGTVTPDGSAVTSCRFEYGADASGGYTQSVPCLEDVGASEEAVAVHADLSGLMPGSSYHFKLVAANANGTEEGADQTFGTPAPPEVSGIEVSHVSDTEASVSAEIDPQRLATTYRVEYGASEAYGMHTRALELVSRDAGSHRVTVELAGLEPSTAYHARLVASNALGTAASADAAFDTSQPVVASCPNEALRTGLSARLPDCRAYEQVSVREKEGASTSEALHMEGVGGENGLLFKAASDGDSMYYVTSNAIAGSPAGGQAGYEAQRSASGWLTSPLSPPNLLETTPHGSASLAVRTAEYTYLSEDLSCKIVQTGEPLTANTPAADVSHEVINLYRRNADGSYTLITNVVPENPEASFEGYEVLGVTPDCKKVVFVSEYLFMSSPPPGRRWIYEWDEGALRPAGVLAGGRLPFFGDDPAFLTSRSETGLVSEDGSRIFFEALGGSFQVKLFMREGNGTAAARTVEVDASQTSAPGGNVLFQAASKTGGRVFFLGNPGLTPGNPHTSGSCRAYTGQECDLYEYDTDSGELTDLSVDANPLDADANVDGVFAISADGSYVYFAAKGQLTPASGDPEENTEAQNEAQLEANVYLAHAGSLAFVGRIDDNRDNADPVSQTAPEGQYNDLLNWPDYWAARATPDGRALLFTSASRLTGYDNTDAGFSTPDPEAYLYSAETGRTVCVSCDPSGARPAYESVEGEARLAINPIVPLSKNGGLQKSQNNQPRALSDDGRRVFFETTDQLSPLAKSGEDNVYEWEQAGAGSCTASSRAYSEASGGCVYLLDSGLPESELAVPATFVDASASGDDVFLRTPSKLLPEDEDNLADIYDARVDGGFAGQQAAVPCEGEACQGLAAGVPAFATPATAALSGTGNQSEPQTHGRRKGLSRAQRLARDLRACGKKTGRHRRRACRRRARKRYRAVKAHKSARRRGGRR